MPSASSGVKHAHRRASPLALGPGETCRPHHSTLPVALVQRLLHGVARRVPFFAASSRSASAHLARTSRIAPPLAALVVKRPRRTPTRAYVSCVS